MDIKPFQELIPKVGIKSEVKSAVLYFRGRKMFCEGKSEDGEMSVSATSEKINQGVDFTGAKPIEFPDLEYLSKMLKTVDGDVQINVNRSTGTSQLLTIKDELFDMKYNLSPTNKKLYSMVPILTRLPPERCERVEFDRSFVDKFTKLVTGIKDCKYVFAEAEDGVISFILSQSENYNSGARLKLECESKDTVPMLKYTSNKMKKVLYANKSANESYLTLYNGGIKIDYSYDEYDITYYFLTQNYLD